MKFDLNKCADCKELFEKGREYEGKALGNFCLKYHNKYAGEKKQ